jgi:aminoglycoside phosphotransferase (APT) family kinase protein
MNAFSIESIGQESEWERPAYVDVSPATLSALIRLWRPNGVVRRCELISKGARNTNYRVGFEGGQTEFVMRLYASDFNAWKKEPALRRLLSNQVPMQSLVYSGFEPSLFDRPLTVYEYVEGETLLDRLASGYRPPEALLRHLGNSLAGIHAHRYEKIGCLDDRLQVAEDLPPFEDWVDLFLNEKARARLGREATERYCTFVRRHKSELEQIAQWNALVHGDYRPTNIVIQGDQLAAVIDWEFCMADHPFSDLGQITRHGWMSASMESEFVRGYNELSAVPLSGNWKPLARLRDSINLLQLIGRATEAPKMYADLKRLIMSVVEQP